MRSIAFTGFLLGTASFSLLSSCSEGMSPTIASGSSGGAAGRTASAAGGGTSLVGGSVASGGSGAGGASARAGGTTGASAGGTTGFATGGASGKATGGTTGNATGNTAGSATGGATSTATGGATSKATGGATAATTGGAAGGSSTAGGTTGGSTGGGTGARDGGSSGGSTGTATGGRTGATGGTGGTTGTTSGYPLGNPAVPSAGCGKSLATYKPGTNTYKMTSAGLSREYIVLLPSPYDSSKPHRLVFGMHWMNGSADAVQGWSKWFGLAALDTESSTIFVAPQGYTDGMPWRGDDKDHTFFEELLAALASSLCIDTSRVFSVGFSFGAMYTNALAQNHQGVLRGVVVYATADYNIYFPANTGKPLAYMGVHGLKDPTCPIDSGRRSRDRFVKNNGCTIPTTVPEAKAGGNYVSYDYACPSNYPVRWVTFDGKHTYPPNDTGTWVYGSTWEFITRF